MVYSYYGIYKMLFVQFNLLGNDFIKGYYVACNYIEGKEIYQMPEGINPFYYIPLAIMVFVPFTVLKEKAAVICWFGLCHIAILLSGCMLVKSIQCRDKLNAATAIAIAMCSSMPLYQNILSGNINIFIYAGICAIIYYELCCRKAIPGILISICGYLKIYPIILLLAYAKNRRFKTVYNFFLYGVMLGAVSVLAFGVKSHIAFIQNLPSLSKYVGAFHCMSFSYILKLFVPAINHTINILLSSIFSVVLFSIWWRKRGSNSLNAKAHSSLILDLLFLIVIIVSVVPSAWLMYHALFIPGFYFIIYFMLAKKEKLKHSALLIILLCAINLWEIAAYHLPVALNGATIIEIGNNMAQFPIAYPILHSLPFFINLIYFYWLLVNYDILKGLFCSISLADR